MLILKNVNIMTEDSFEIKNILIKEGIITKIDDNFSKEFNNQQSHFLQDDYEIIDCKNKLILPGFINMHAHSSMSILRGYGDDMPLHDWLTKKIWPVEAKLTKEDCYWGARFAYLEMIKSGITCCCDMYLNLKGVMDAAYDSGIKGYISQVTIDFFEEDKSISERNIAKANYSSFNDESNKYKDQIKFVISPHAIYSVSEKTLLWCKRFAEQNNLFLHMHLSETEKEVFECLKKHGLRPVEYLEKIGFLTSNMILAHGVWISEKEANILKKYKSLVVHNPTSNMKLSVGGKFPIGLYQKERINLALGTDSASSNNSLDMFETMKYASLLAKHNYINPEICNMKSIYDMATKNAYEFLGINGGIIKEGASADIILIDMNHYSLIPCNDIISNIIYSAKTECIDTVICGGKVLMKNRVVKDERMITQKIKEISKKVLL